MLSATVDYTSEEQIYVRYLQAINFPEIGRDHWHDLYELYFNMGNAMSYYMDRKTCCVRRNDVVLINRNTIHHALYGEGQNHSRIVVMFRPSVLNAIDDESIRDRISGLFTNVKCTLPDVHEQQDLSSRFNLLVKLAGEAGQHDPIGRLRLRFELIALLLTLAAVFPHVEVDTPCQTMGKKEKHVTDVICHIENNYREPLTLDDIASALFINKYYLSHAFKEQTGIGLVQYINMRRLIEAERLMRDTTRSVTYICNEVGFKSLSHFIDVLTRAYGCTPTAFRKKLSAEK